MESSPAPKNPHFLRLFNSDTHYPIYNSLCNYLSIADIITLTRTCKQFSSLYQNLIPTKWDSDKKLRRFLAQPRAFRSQMGKHGALISGSFAVQFFERVTWPDADLDVFVRYGDEFESLSKYLVEAERYQLKSSTVPGYSVAIDDLAEVCRRMCRSALGLTIQLSQIRTFL